MKLKISINSIILSISISILPLSDRLYGCGGGDPVDIISQSIFTPEIINRNYEYPLFLTSDDYYGQYTEVNSEGLPDLSEITEKEWSAAFEPLNGIEISTWIVFASTVTQLDTLEKFYSKSSIDTIKCKIPKEAFQLKNNATLHKYITYLKIARNAEKVIQSQYQDWLPYKVDSVEIENITRSSKKQFEKEKNSFLKSRYGFQMIRGLFLSRRYEECIATYDKYFKADEARGSMYYRTLGFKAGALYKMQQYAASNYIYSKIYDQFPEMKLIAFASFHVQEEEDWKGCLFLAKNNHEKEILWQLFGVYADPLKGMKEIYAIHPASELMELLLVRAINIVETVALENQNNEMYDYDESSLSPTRSWKSINTKNLGELADFVQTAATNPTIHQPAVWKSCAAFMEVLNNDFASAKLWLEQSEKDKSCTELIHGQNIITESILYTRQITKINEKEEEEIYQRLSKLFALKDSRLRSENTINYLLFKLSKIYAENGNLQKSELCNSNVSAYFNEETIHQLIEFIQATKHNSLENYLIQHYHLTLADLYNELAIQKIYIYDFQGAFETFSKVEGAGNTDLNANPFTIHIVDCHDCDYGNFQNSKETKLSFVKKMLEIKTIADSSNDPEIRAQNYFLFANGLYNMTWYGNNRVIHESFASDWEGETNRFAYSKPTSTNSFFDCAEALKYYEKALNLTKKKELKARNAWMAAKCEHNIWLEEFYSPNGANDFSSGKYFQLLKNQFSDTKYYSEIINECGYFCTYLYPGNEKCIRNK